LDPSACSLDPCKPTLAAEVHVLPMFGCHTTLYFTVSKRGFVDLFIFRDRVTTPTRSLPVPPLAQAPLSLPRRATLPVFSLRYVPGHLAASNSKPTTQGAERPKAAQRHPPPSGRKLLGTLSGVFSVAPPCSLARASEEISCQDLPSYRAKIAVELSIHHERAEAVKFRPFGPDGLYPHLRRTSGNR
jgi:hypothetical protein